MKIKEINKMCNTNYSSVEEFQNKVSWLNVSVQQKLSESFIREFQDKVYWGCISENQLLSESFIREFRDKVNWSLLTGNQKLSEEFIREFQDKVSWDGVSIYQTLSESFIREFKDKVNWKFISTYQKLSEEFIREFKDKVDWEKISKYQKLSTDFIIEFRDKLIMRYIEDSWHYKDVEFKKQAVIDTGLFKCYDDYFIAYKYLDKNRFGPRNFHHQYKKGSICEGRCDCTCDDTYEYNSFGLHVKPEKDVYKQPNYPLVVKVKIQYEDIGRVLVDDDGKVYVRCFKLKVLN